ncbi:MAG TPA: MerR family transcriptional regulator [Candidatus Handelsmanbacteria bacterium]|nr:MerR family transcriptional regulator [Candidatus Handelsmanbacteria bacterium]
MPGEYTLEELAKMVRINPRTIRSYIQQGLLSGPDSMGRNARYKDYHLKRLRVIRTLKEVHHLPLSEIRRLVTMAGPEEDIQIQLVPLDGEMQVEAREISEEEASAPSSALDYVRARRASAKGRRVEETAALPAPPPIMSSPIDQGDSVTSPLEALLYKLRDQGTLDHVPRKTRGEEWVRLEVTPDIEIHVRGQLRREQLSDFEQLADLMRHILLGSEDDE